MFSLCCPFLFILLLLLLFVSVFIFVTFFIFPVNVLYHVCYFVTPDCNWVIERLLFNVNSAIYQLYHGENKLIFNEMMMRSAWYYTNTISWIFMVLVHWNKSPRVDMSLHTNTLSWFWANQYLLLLLNAACFAEKQHISIL
jgi:hypothetical protein